jgi:heme oxygenase
MGLETDIPAAHDQPGSGAQGPKPPELLVTLRGATASLHAQVEALPAMVRLMSEAVGPSDYLHYLAGLGRVYGALEPPLLAALDRALAGRPELRPPIVPKLAAIREDLAALGLPDPSPQGGMAPDDLGTTVGGLYVLEGTTLGGQVIARHLNRRLEADVGQVLAQARFLGFYGERTSAHWKAFAGSLDGLVDLGLVRPESAVAGACETFERVLAIFSESGA